MESQLAVHVGQRSRRVEKQEVVVVVVPVRAQVHAKTNLLVAESKAQTLAHEGGSRLKIGHRKDNVADSLRIGALAPTPMLVEPDSMSRSVTGLGRAKNGLPLEHPQSHGETEICHEMDCAIRIATHFAILGQISRQALQRVPIFDTPDGFADARSHHHRRRQRGIVLLPQHHRGALRQSETRFGGTRLFEAQTKILEEPPRLFEDGYAIYQ